MCTVCIMHVRTMRNDRYTHNCDISCTRTVLFTGQKGKYLRSESEWRITYFVGRTQKIPSGVGRVGVLTACLFSHQRISQKAVRTSLEKQLDLRMVHSFSRGVRVPEFQLKPIATCDVPGMVSTPCPPPSVSAHVLSALAFVSIIPRKITSGYRFP